MKLKSSLLLFGICLFSQCISDNALKTRVENTLDELKLLKDNLKVVMIIPSSGCSGCINDSEKYLLEHLGSKHNTTLFVLTSYRNKKEVRIKLGLDILSQSNVFFDSTNMFFQKNAISIYPIIYYTLEQELVLVSPDNPEAIKNLISYMKTHL